MDNMIVVTLGILIIFIGGILVGITTSESVVVKGNSFTINDSKYKCTEVEKLKYVKVKESK